MLDLALESLLVFFILLLVLALDDLLCLFGHTVELHVECSLLVVLDLEIETLDLTLDLLQTCVMLENLLHLVDLRVALVTDLVVFRLDHVKVDQDGILVVCGDR